MTRRVLVLFGLLGMSWVVMTTTHEFGHLLAGWWVGASLIDVDIAPWRFPYSTHQPDPHPLVTLWGGPVLGALLPLATAMLVRSRSVWFVADFCLLANGAYLAASWFSGARELDSPRLLAAGASPLSIFSFCTFSIPIGYYRFRKDCIQILGPAIK